MPNRKKEDLKQTTNYKLYMLDKRFKQNSNLIKYVEEAENFYNGNQYPGANLVNDIRVVMNICSFSVNLKASKIVGTPLHFKFIADNETDTIALRRFHEYNCLKMRLKEHNFQAVKNAYITGTELTYIAWDDDDTSYKGIYKGGLRLEHIDLRNFALANPYLSDIQNQEWIMIWEEYPIKAVKEMVEGANKKEIEEKIRLIERTAMKDDDYKEKHNINHGLVRMFTRFFRIDGEVYFMCSTEDVDIFTHPHPLSRKISKKIVEKVVEDYKKAHDKQDFEEYNKGENQVFDYAIDYEDFVMQATKNKAFTNAEYRKVKEKFSLYPFAIYRPKPINRSAYGNSDIKSLIPIQKGINFQISMNLKAAENNAYGKILVKPETLQGQKITNEPGQVIVDHSPFMNGWGLKFAEGQPMPNGLIESTNSLLAMTRVIYGFNDVMDGSLTNQDMSGYMLQQMIKQSNTALEQEQQLFWRYSEDIAAICLMFYKHYVDKGVYSYELTDYELEAEEQARKQIYSALLAGRKLETLPNASPSDFAKETSRIKFATIDNNDMYGINFDIAIEAVQGLNDSKIAEQQMWDNLLLNGGIQNIPPETLAMYLQASPNISPESRNALKGVVENLKQSEIASLQRKNEELAMNTANIIDYAKRLESAMNYSSEYLKNLEMEFKTKIGVSNKTIESQNRIIDGLRRQAVSEGEAKSNNAKGIEGSRIEELEKAARNTMS